MNEWKCRLETQLDDPSLPWLREGGPPYLVSMWKEFLLRITHHPDDTPSDSHEVKAEDI